MAWIIIINKTRRKVDMMFDSQYNISNRNDKQYRSCPVYTSQITYELEALVEIYKERKPRITVEIGTEFGGTLYQWITNGQTGMKIINIDKWDQKLIPEDPRPQWNSWVSPGIELVTIFGDSHDPATKEILEHELENDMIDFLFIDGDHTYEGAKADWLMYGPMVRKGGIVSFHDLIQPVFSLHIGVPILWKEIRRAGYITRELFSAPEGIQSWGGIGVVYK